MICFTRVPRAGDTKTRLMPDLSGEECAALQWAFLKDLRDVYASLDAALFIAAAEGPLSGLRALFPEAVIFRQQGDSLGERMDFALRRVLDLGYSRCVLTGSDLPELTAEHLRTAFTLLYFADICLGPSGDGGYYLVGLKQPCPALFSISGYGGTDVLFHTVEAAKRAGKTVSLAPLCRDVDTVDDLLRLRGTLAENAATREYLRGLRLWSKKLS